MDGKINFFPCSSSFRSCFKSNDDNESNLRSQSFSIDSFNSSFSSKSSLPSSVSALIPPSNTVIRHQCIATFKPNSSQMILSLTLTENLVVSGSSTHIHLWPRHPTTDPYGIGSIPCNVGVKALQILDESILISGHQDHKIRIWKFDVFGSSTNRLWVPHQTSCIINKVKLITSLPTLKDRLTKSLFAKNYVKIRRHKTRTWIHHNDVISSLAVSVDKSLIYSASWDRSFKIWRSSDFKCLESISNAHDDAINAIVVSEEGFVYTGSADKKIKVWKGRNKLYVMNSMTSSSGSEVWRNNRSEQKHDLIDTLEHHKSAVNALAYDDNSSVLISGACSGVMIASERNFSVHEEGRHMVVVGALLGHKKAILCVKMVGELVCSSSADKTVRLWRKSAGKSYSCLGVLEGHGGPVKCLAMTSETSEFDSEDYVGTRYMVYSGSLDGEIKVWNVWVPLAMELL